VGSSLPAGSSETLQSLPQCRENSTVARVSSPDRPLRKPRGQSARCSLPHKPPAPCACSPAQMRRSASAFGLHCRRSTRTRVHAKAELRAGRHNGWTVDDAPRREIGESQVRTAAAAETCSGLDALLLQSLIGGASGRDALAPAGRPWRKPRAAPRCVDRLPPSTRCSTRLAYRPGGLSKRAANCGVLLPPGGAEIAGERLAGSRDLVPWEHAAEHGHGLCSRRQDRFLLTGAICGTRVTPGTRLAFPPRAGTARRGRGRGSKVKSAR
jgi:hypothetical protein